MSHTVVYSPVGEMFEVSALNAHDLVTHAGWTYKAADGEAPAPKPEATPIVEDEDKVEETDDTSGNDDDDAEDAGDDADADAPFTTEEQFAELTDREAVVAYLAQHYPDFTPHHLAKRESLIAKAIELAAE